MSFAVIVIEFGGKQNGGLRDANENISSEILVKCFSLFFFVPRFFPIFLLVAFVCFVGIYSKIEVEKCPSGRWMRPASDAMGLTVVYSLRPPYWISFLYRFNVNTSAFAMDSLFFRVL